MSKIIQVWKVNNYGKGVIDGSQDFFRITPDPPPNGGGAEWGEITGTLSNQTDLQEALNQATFTVELIDELTVDIYAPYDLKINDFEVIVGSGTITIQVNDSVYTLETLIDQGDKITVTTTTASVVNLEVSYE
jgi:hypothetical protein